MNEKRRLGRYSKTPSVYSPFLYRKIILVSRVGAWSNVRNGSINGTCYKKNFL